MTYQFVVDALLAKEAELVRDLESIHRKMDRLRSDLSELRAVEAFHRQNIDNADFLPHMSIRRQFKQNEIRGLCITALKAFGGCLDTRQLASFVIERKGLDTQDAALKKKIVFSVMQAMKTARRKRIVIDAGHQLGVRLWRLV